MYTAIETLYHHFLQSTGVTTDTRNCPTGSIFFALKGGNFDGNQYAYQALEKGCTFAVVDNPDVAINSQYLVVVDVLEMLQALARHHRERLNIPVIGITGTNGKTTTKELVLAVLQTQYRTLATEGNLNNHIGVPLTLLKIKPEHEIAIIEMGANHPFEIQKLCQIARPTMGLITNVGKAHLEGFGSFEGVIKTKTELYEWLRYAQGSAFIYSENNILMDHLEGVNTITYGNHPKAKVRGKVVAANPQIKVLLQLENEEALLNTQLIGTYNLPNILAAAAIGVKLNVTSANIIKGLASFQPANKRSQLIQTSNNQLILDAYNANPTSMLAALENFAAIEGQHKTLILGDMRELGENSKQEHQSIYNWIKTHTFEQTYFVGKEFSSIADDPSNCFEDTTALKNYILQHPLSEQIILIKGSRGITLESLVEIL